ncbi:hypothetical protein F5144DRAFT_588304 [Chaetomium tenue]|uniref:Uncharacterized protein n=1 Tax=Chaetomium tenue TaxID=1854479 RepID=A0ACB7PMT4_9PEZI|nr:hypothetical protein F5144DRAFT_588304 [Chaetomium globosum]
MTENGKRKDAPGGGGDSRSKKKKTGNAGKWKTSHQQAKVLAQDSHLQPGDTGVWVTCARHQEAKAAREIGVLFSEYAENLYDIKSVHDAKPSDGDDDGAEDDIEAAIAREVAALTAKPTPTSGGTSAEEPNRMTPLKMNVDCLLYVKTQPPVDPVAFVRRICEDARRCGELPGLMRCRYVNRLTPISVMGKASENGLVEVAKEALKEWFDLGGKQGPEGEVKPTVEGELADDGDDKNDATEADNQAPVSEEVGSEKKPFTFAIRPTIRNHSNLKRDVVINTVAKLINGDLHKVNLTSPDKVILIDIYQVNLTSRLGPWFTPDPDGHRPEAFQRHGSGLGECF